MLQLYYYKLYNNMSKKKKSIGPFKVGEYAVFPLHGLALIADISEISVGSETVECIKLEFEKKKVSLFLPLKKLEAQGLRPLIKSSEADEIFSTLKENSKFLRVIWNRRSKEYENKIQSGSIYHCAEVVRDLYKNTNNPNRSYTEAVIYTEALFRLSSELAIVTKKSFEEIEEEVNSILKKYHETYQSINSQNDDEDILMEDFKSSQKAINL
jgi:CarD family transcriptional regulator